jgi:glutamine kinase
MVEKYSISEKKRLEQIFTSKSNVLKFLENKIKFSKIEKNYDFTIEQWNENKKIIIKEISEKFKSKKIIIRSSAIGEDSLEKSEAGNYDSILNINSESTINVKNAINKVIKSYELKNNSNPNNQILVQTQTQNIKLSGVVMTHAGNLGAPYYVINYEVGPSSIGVTSGKIGNTIKIFKKTNLKNLEPKWKLLIKSIKEIEKKCKNTSLDIEFAITKNRDIILFQVRPLVSKHITKFPNLENIIIKKISENKKKYSKIEKEIKIHGKQKIFSDMTDWNPAEIIGNNPNELDYSLYDFLIMSDAWGVGREQMGYQDIHPHNLMTRFGNKPYVDVRVSFNSLIPKKIKKELRIKLMDYYLNNLIKNPHLHDKVEFEILFTCYDFMLKKRMNKLEKFGFNNVEINEIKEILIEFTNEVIHKFPETLKENKLSIKKMTRNRIRIKNTLKNKNNNYKKYLDAVEELLKDCKEYGTIPFSTMARIAFISSILLKSLVKREKINNSFYDNFMRSIETPVTRFQDDLEKYTAKKLVKKDFIKKYGHLRPGTYDLLAQRYDQNDEFFKNITFTKPNKQNKKINQKNNLKQELIKSPLNFQEKDFLSFVKNALSQREELKFEFTHNLSDALELIADAGEKLGFTREDMVNLDIKTILTSNKKLVRKDIIKSWKKKIKENKNDKNINNNLVLSPIIFSKKDFEIIRYHITKPNFITSKSITTEILNLDHQKEFLNLQNKIIVIENADPGFDWIFSKNPAGLITKYGGVASHMAIRCAEIGLPAAIGCGEIIFDNIVNSHKILLDCKNEQITILQNNESNEYIEERKVLKSLGYIK